MLTTSLGVCRLKTKKIRNTNEPLPKKNSKMCQCQCYDSVILLLALIELIGGEGEGGEVELQRLYRERAGDEGGCFQTRDVSWLAEFQSVFFCWQLRGSICWINCEVIASPPKKPASILALSEGIVKETRAQSGCSFSLPSWTWQYQLKGFLFQGHNLKCRKKLRVDLLIVSYRKTCQIHCAVCAAAFTLHFFPYI